MKVTKKPAAVFYVLSNSRTNGKRIENEEKKCL